MLKHMLFALLSISSLVGYAADDAVEHRYYPVYGKTYSQLVDDINHQARYGYYPNNQWHISWQFGFKPKDDGCYLVYPKVAKKIVLKLPRWTDKAEGSPALQKEWDRYLAAVKKHQLGHVDYANQCHDAVLEVLKSIPKQKSCDELKRIANQRASKLVDKYEALNKKYENETKHGKTQGVYFNPVD